MTGKPTPEERIARLEQMLGPLEDPANPTGQEALLDADARSEVLPALEKVLDACTWNAELVPEELGGRLSRMDVLGRVLRPVFRRDASAGFGYGLNCFFAAAPVFSRGSDEQRTAVARILLDGGRVALVRQELAHGNNLLRGELTMTPRDAAAGGGYLLTGSKSVVVNASRADGLVVFARMAGDEQRRYSMLLLDRRHLPPGRLVPLARQTTSGMPGAEFGGVRAQDCPVPESALVGQPGDGYELSLRSSLVVRGLIPSVLLSAADTALRTVARCALRPRHGRSMLDVRHSRAVLAGAFLDLLMSDCLALVATRALHLLPGQSSAVAAAAAYVAPKILAESMDALAAVLGERSFAEEGDYRMFRKQVRDMPVTSLGHAGSAGRQVTLLPQLPFFARNSWFADAEAPAALFRPHEGLPPLDLVEPALLADADPLAATLVAGTDALEADPAGPATLRFLARAHTAELAELREAFRAVPPGDRRALADPHCFSLADRYALLLAGAACLGVWRAARDGAGGFLADPAWPTAALYRLGRRLGLALPDRPAEAEERMLSELLSRTTAPRSYDLYATDLARWES
ncbi:hypothetical protein BFF78_19300 [Streptomyces fodineus]|uniref:Acyl-CoA dehydrogenase n=1 Tax=Streptomyces fodineus TaxID=1904616 RepID=A0A1D7YBC1_9ACTN|nr:hypothetical protein [Streptomyces fodineus]AOR32923.1 hypothetical protein BFF78_19300 [Streptomyces fodineus]